MEILINCEIGKVIVSEVGDFRINPLLPIEREIMEAGGLTAYNLKRMAA